MKRTTKVIPLGNSIAILACAFARDARAQDPIAAWNEIAEKAVKTAGDPPPVAVRWILPLSTWQSTTPSSPLTAGTIRITPMFATQRVL